jgi:hypothetical protein
MLRMPAANRRCNPHHIGNSIQYEFVNIKVPDRLAPLSRKNAVRPSRPRGREAPQRVGWVERHETHQNRFLPHEMIATVPVVWTASGENKLKLVAG